MVTPGWVNKTDPDDMEITLVLRTAGLSKYTPMFPFEPSTGEPARPGGRRVPPKRTREKWVGSYFIKMEGRDSARNIKLYVYIFKTGSLALKGTWSGYDKAACDAQFQRMEDTARAAIMRRGLKK